MSKYKPAPFKEPSAPLPPDLIPKTDGKFALVTDDLIHKIRSRAGGWNRIQLDALGVEWPPKKGWRKPFKSGVQIPLEKWEIAVANCNRL